MPATQPFRIDLLRLMVRDEGLGARDVEPSSLSPIPVSPSLLIGPNLRLFIAATGRAPIVKTSRRMPPTPVAAPWYGSMKLGWLCDSILKTAAKPSPMSTTPAFSPGPWMTRGPFVGRRFKWKRDDLYEQCSLHITLKTPSSVYVGVRPRCFSTSVYSSVVSLCCLTRGGVIGRSPGNGFGAV